METKDDLIDPFENRFDEICDIIFKKINKIVDEETQKFANLSVELSEEIMINVVVRQLTYVGLCCGSEDRKKSISLINHVRKVSRMMINSYFDQEETKNEK